MRTTLLRSGLRSGLLMASLSATATGQSLAVGVTLNADASTDVSVTMAGAPNGVGALLLSTGKTLPPLASPFGPFYLAPPVFALPAIPFGPTGSANLTFSLLPPMPAAAVYFQAGVVDFAAQTVALSGYSAMAYVSGFELARNGGGWGIAGSYDQATMQWSACATGKPGDEFKVTDKNGKELCKGRFPPHPNNFVWCQGQLTESSWINLHRNGFIEVQLNR